MNIQNPCIHAGQTYSKLCAGWPFLARRYRFRDAGSTVVPKMYSKVLIFLSISRSDIVTEKTFCPAIIVCRFKEVIEHIHSGSLIPSPLSLLTELTVEKNGHMRDKGGFFF